MPSHIQVSLKIKEQYCMTKIEPSQYVNQYLNGKWFSDGT